MVSNSNPLLLGYVISYLLPAISLRIRGLLELLVLLYHFAAFPNDSVQQVIEEVQVGNLPDHFGLAFAVSNTPAGSHTVALAFSSGTGGTMPIHQVLIKFGS